jgi:hypothetical protein
LLVDWLGLLGIDPGKPSTLPFAAGDTTAGSETELQAGVFGRRENADLPLTIEQSNYFANVIRRAAAGDTSQRAVTALERYLESNADNFWENSWVRFPRRLLNSYGQLVFATDLLADKSDPGAGSRSDLHRFLFTAQGEEHLRVPISYLIKLSLAESLDVPDQLPHAIHASGVRVMAHFLNDNTSPETSSFHIVSLRPQGRNGRALAGETSQRYLFTQLLLLYGNEKFRLKETGQEGVVFFSPHPPMRQKGLNDCISDAFYRELFMSPCLSGWNRGEAKREYMTLCHQVLSRSHLNAVAKLREAGIITRNLVVLPNTSNICLANNGTHVSLGSRKLTKALSDKSSGFTTAHEKHFCPCSLGPTVPRHTASISPTFIRKGRWGFCLMNSTIPTCA